LTRQIGFDLLEQVLLGKNPSRTAQAVSGLLPIVTVLPFSRAQEREADRLGLDFLWRAGYRPEAMVDFMAKLMAHEQVQRAGPPLRFLSSHPATAERIRQLDVLIEQFPPDLRAQSQLNAESYQVVVLQGLGVTIRRGDR
jgi:predicted Zn-dependent protease